MTFFKNIHRIFGLRFIIGLLGLQSVAGSFINIIKNIRLLTKTKISEDKKERGTQFLKEYFCGNLQNKKEKLKDWLDENSKKIIDTVMGRYLFIATHEFAPPFLEQEIIEQKIIRKFMVCVNKMYHLPLDYYEPNVFYYHCGLKVFNNKVVDRIKSYLKEKDVIDAGAFIGDSALMFLREYNCKRIFAFEPESKNYNLLQKTIEINKCSKITPVKKGLGDKTGRRVSIASVGSSSCILRGVNDVSGEIVELTTIDDFVNKNQYSNIGLIKMDIEGYEYEAIKGAIETIRKNQPILLISIYHNPVDFFEIKPYLEKLNLDYQFFVRKINPFNLVYETMLICIPKKIL